MNTISRNRAALAVAGLYGVCHASWAALVALGWAKPLWVWILSLHFIVIPIEITGFQWSTAVLLVAFTSGAGYVTGWILAELWNRVLVGG